MPFLIDFTPAARDHVRALRKRDQQIVLDAIERHLAAQADVPTRNRKRLEENSLAPWELRVGGFRVFFDILRDDGETPRVLIVAIGQKSHNRLFIGGEEVQL